MHFIQSCVPTKAHQLREQHNLTGGDYSHRSEDLVAEVHSEHRQPLNLMLPFANANC